ncbi:MAG TPA: enoyl-CoA hydratase-related protein [Solirubrobacterales bacterium]|nr:enoyl-CoA hydratase-related protein [Solirubrobacterales bacterium]
MTAGPADPGGEGPGSGEPASLAGGKLLLDYPVEAVARLTISNPERRNALDHDILDALAEALPWLDRGIEIRCVMITGAGETFSAGYDIAGLADETFAEDAEALVAHPFHAAMEAISAHPYPVLAAINGHCLGGGLELAVRCDLRLSAVSAKLGMPPAKLGLIYGHTGLRKFIDVVGYARTKELFLTGRTMSAPRAMAIGLVNDTAPDEKLAETALELAAEIASNAPLSMRGNKRAIEAVGSPPPLDPDEERELIELRRSCFTSEDLREGVRAFAERRKPKWTGR